MNKNKKNNTKFYIKAIDFKNVKAILKNIEGNNKGVQNV